MYMDFPAIRVKIGSMKCSRKERNKGEPLICYIFMNDLFHFVKHANLFNYADDYSVIG